MNEDIPGALDRATRREIEQALDFAKRHPRLFALKPAANVTLAVTLGVYAVAHLATMFFLVFGTP